MFYPFWFILRIVDVRNVNSTQQHLYHYHSAKKNNFYKEKFMLQFMFFFLNLVITNQNIKNFSNKKYNNIINTHTLNIEYSFQDHLFLTNILQALNYKNQTYNINF